MSDERPSEPESTPPPRGRGGERRLLFPSAIVFVAALVVSLGLHLNAYVGLATLRGLLDTPAAVAPMEVSFDVIEVGAPTPPDETPEADAPRSAEPDDEPPPPRDVPEPRERTRDREEPPRAAPTAPPPPPPERAPSIQEEAAPQTPAAPTPPPPPDDRRSIVQRSDDPNVENPNARFLADEARVVEEETVANLRNTQRDDPDPSAASGEADPNAAREGDGDEQVSADLRDVEGDDRRHATPDEAERQPPREAIASVSPTPSDRGSATASAGETAPRAGTPRRGESGGRRARGGGAPAGEDVLVSDGFGSYVVRVPPETTGDVPGDGAGRRVEGPGRGSEGLGRLAGRRGERGGGAERRSGSRGGPQLGLGYADFEAVYGEDELRHEREARLEERRSRSPGARRAAEWSAFRAAIENYTPEIRPGNQTALNAAASPFATFLSDMHRRIHREFADGYIASLGLDASEGLNDPSLRTTLEIAVNEDGSLYRVGIAATSGNTLFDFGAFSSVWRAQPFPRPPSIILSGDGHAWLRWHFDRGPRHCGTWNAEPYLLANGAGPIDRGEPGEPPPPRRAPSPAAGPALPGTREG